MGYPWEDLLLEGSPVPKNPQSSFLGCCVKFLTQLFPLLSIVELLLPKCNRFETHSLVPHAIFRKIFSVTLHVFLRNCFRQRGDRFEIDCFYDTSLSSVDPSDVTFGFGSQDEM